ncbi:Hypothetical predicted protein, partial [Drosophila guanche]
CKAEGMQMQTDAQRQRKSMKDGNANEENLEVMRKTREAAIFNEREWEPEGENATETKEWQRVERKQQLQPPKGEQNNNRRLMKKQRDGSAAAAAASASATATAAAFAAAAAAAAASSSPHERPSDRANEREKAKNEIKSEMQSAAHAGILDSNEGLLGGYGRGCVVVGGIVLY